MPSKGELPSGPSDPEKTDSTHKKTVVWWVPVLAWTAAIRLPLREEFEPITGVALVDGGLMAGLLLAAGSTFHVGAMLAFYVSIAVVNFFVPEDEEVDINIDMTLTAGASLLASIVFLWAMSSR